jgi:small subunit ribosomal protein S2
MQEEQGIGSVANIEVKAKNQQDDYFAGFDFSKLEISVEEMFKNGVHFGHKKSRKNPKMEGYIFTTKNGINIINLQRTEEKLKEALEFIKNTVSQNQDILFVGTKKQAKRLIESAANATGMPFVSERWLGGTFTNYKVISDRVKYIRDQEEKIKKGDIQKYTKFEQMKIKDELEKLNLKMGGIKNMTKMPGAVFVASVSDDKLPIREAQAKNIPVIALVDTNADPTGIDYPVPANEDAVSSLRLLLAYVAGAVLEGKEKRAANPQ